MQKWMPIGAAASNYYFRGNLDGDGHSISGLYIESNAYKYARLFRCISNATISNLKVSGSVNNTYPSNTSNTGEIVGYSSTGSTIEYSVSSVTVSVPNSTKDMFVGEIAGTKFSPC